MHLQLDKLTSLLHSVDLGRRPSHDCARSRLLYLQDQQFLVGTSMNDHPKRPVLIAAAFCIVSIFSAGQVFAQSLDEVLGVRAETTQQGRRSQAKIDELTDETRDLLSQYKQVMKIVDGLRVYNQQQERLIQSQEEEMADLNDSIERVTVIERQMGPLIERMISNLEEFVELDLPFLEQEREERIDFLKELMDRADVAVSEKFSQVLDAYQVENSYGSTIEAYTDVIEIDGKQRQVDMLKWGRVVLAFQTPDQEITGAWDHRQNDWVMLDDSYRSAVRDGLRMARQTKTPDLVRLPVPAPEE